MTESPPILVRWNGATFEPANAPMVRRCEQFFVANEIYRIEFRDERSGVSHRHFFASVNEAWKNLPDDIADRFPTAEHLRKWALIKAGYADERTLAWDTPEDAAKFAATARLLDSYAVIVLRASVVKIYTARSMSVRAMDRKTFQAAKQATLDIVADLIGVDPATLASNAQHDDHEQPNEIPDRAVERAHSQNPPARITGSPDDAPPPGQAGGFTPLATTPQNQDGKRPEQRPPGGGEPLPKNYDEYRIYLKAWLGFVAKKRMHERLEREKQFLWPTFNPPLTAGQAAYLENTVLDTIAGAQS